MRLPAQIYKVSKFRGRQRPADFEEREPFARFPAWLRVLSRLPLPAWYGFSRFLAWLLERVLRRNVDVVDTQLAACFPDRDAAWVEATRRTFYRNFAEVSVEIVKAVTMAPEEIDRRVEFVGDDAARRCLDGGQSIIVLTSHNCNWEWTLLKLSMALGCPVQAAYKPLKGRYGDRLMLTLRSRFGAQMIRHKRFLMRVLRHRGPARIVAMVADQDPTTSALRYFTHFMGLDTAFFIGPEAIARGAGLPVWYLAMRRVARGRYRVTFVPLAATGETLAPGQLIDRFAAAVEALTRERPADWLWTYRRWKVQRDAQAHTAIEKSGLSGPGE